MVGSADLNPNHLFISMKILTFPIILNLVSLSFIFNYNKICWEKNFSYSLSSPKSFQLSLSLQISFFSLFLLHPHPVSTPFYVHHSLSEFSLKPLPPLPNSSWMLPFFPLLLTALTARLKPGGLLKLQKLL